MEVRFCKVCENTKSLVEFPINYRSGNHFGKTCQVCRALQLKEHKAKLRKEQPEECLRKKREYTAKNRTKIALKNKEYQQKNKEKVNSHTRKWKKNNSDKTTANCRKRAAAGSIQLTQEQDQKIKQIYQDCKNLKILGHDVQVDHIVPLLHSEVCGLHVPENLQILTKFENLSKKNKFDGTLDNNSWRKNG